MQDLTEMFPGKFQNSWREIFHKHKLKKIGTCVSQLFFSAKFARGKNVFMRFEIVPFFN